MKYVITGAAGHISKLLSLRLLRAGQEVSVIGRNPEHLQELQQAGATTAIGSLEDVEFLKAVFNGADAVYTMCPPSFGPGSQQETIARLGKKYADAISANNIRHVVNLSSVGAHLAEGVGPVNGLHQVEQELNKLSEVNIVHLRPVFFYTNLFMNIGMIKQMGITGGSFSVERFPIVDPSDIAAAAAEELLALNFTGHSVRYIASDETSTNEIAAALGKAIGKPGLQWIQFPEQQVMEGMMSNGMPAVIAKEYIEMFSALNNGKLTEDYWKHHPGELGKVKLEQFAGEFAAAYNNN